MIANSEPWPNRNRIEEIILNPVAPTQTPSEAVALVIEDPMIMFFALEPQTFLVIELNFDESGSESEAAPSEPGTTSPSNPNLGNSSPENSSPSNPSIQILLPDHFENDTQNQFNLRFSYRSQMRR